MVDLAGEELVAVPRNILGAACAALRKKLHAPNTLAELNRYAVHGPALANPSPSPVSAPSPAGGVREGALGWNSPEEWGIEQRAFHAAGRDDVPKDVQELVAILWKQYCIAAEPLSSPATPEPRRHATPIREEDILEVAMEQFWKAEGGNQEGVKAVLEWAKPVFFDMALHGTATPEPVSAPANGEVVEALKATRSIVSDGAMVGFNCHDGDWAERLYKNQARLSTLIRALSNPATGHGEGGL